MSFNGWWVDQGRYLFDHQFVKANVRAMEPEELGFEDTTEPYLYVEVPLNMHRREIVRQFNEILDESQRLESDRDAARRQPRRALYADQRIRFSSIEAMLAVWEARKDTTDEWWQTGEKCKLADQYMCLPDDDAATIKQKRRNMALTAQRMHRMAKALIDFAARGDFPRVK